MSAFETLDNLLNFCGLNNNNATLIIDNETTPPVVRIVLFNPKKYPAKCNLSKWGGYKVEIIESSPPLPFKIA